MRQKGTNTQTTSDFKLKPTLGYGYTYKGLMPINFTIIERKTPTSNRTNGPLNPEVNVFNVFLLKGL